MAIDWIARYQKLVPRVRNFINGRWRSAGEGKVLEKYSPRDGKLLCAFTCAAAQDVEFAVSAARHSFEGGQWSKAAPERRREVLLRLAALLDKHQEEFALLESVDVGKPISDALGFDIPAAAALIRFNAEALDKDYSRVYAVDESSLSYQLRRPIGVVAGVVGWNFPLLLAASKIGPVLAMGNSLVLKPSELTSFSAARVAELAVEAGVPEGVFNVVHGDADVGKALAEHPGVDLLTFTGSSNTGKRLLVAAGESNMKRLVLECGGKAPNIVFDDCPDLHAVADAIIMRAFWNQGQVCSASSRVLIQESIMDNLMPIIIDKASALAPGDPLSPDTRFGALVSRGHVQRIQSYIDIGEREGASKVYHSDAPCPFAGGFYAQPAIFSNVLQSQRIAQEEIFGPVLSVTSFGEEEEAIHLANGTRYGLTAIVWTKSLARAHRVSHGINAGLVVVNATVKATGGPGIGVLSVGGHKESGIGVEGGIEGLQHYTSNTAVQLFV